MKVYKMKPQEDLDALANLIKECMHTESEYETLKCKTDDTDLFQLAEKRQESTTDFIMSILRIFDELNVSSIGMPAHFHLDHRAAKSLIVNLDADVFIRECRKIDENHWHFIMKEMSRHDGSSRIYGLLNKRLEKLNNNVYADQSSPLLVG